MRKKTLLTLALALCCSGTLTAAFVTAGADESLDYSQVEVLQGISTENISVTDLDGNEVSLAAGPHGGSASKSVFVDGIIHSTQTTLLADSAGNGVVGYVTIDAGREYVVNKLLVDIVHDWGAADFSIELSTDAAFSDPIVIYSNKADEGFTADSDHAVSSVLYNKPMQGLTFEFSPVRARYVRITGNTYGNGQLWGWTCLGEVQMWAVQDTLDVYADLPAGSYEGEQEVSLGSTVEGAEIYYTLDGSVPTTSSTKYERPISVIGEQKIRAVAYANGKYGYPFDFNYFASSASDYEIGVNACLNKSVTAYDTQGNEIYAVAHNGGSSLSVVTDGTMGTDNSIGLANADGSAAVGWVQVDMEQSVWINKVNLTLWHDWVFRSITIQVSDDPTFSEGVTTILCTDIGSWIVSSSLAGSMDPTFDYTAYEWFPHSGNGWEFNFAPVKGRYIRTLNQTGSGSMYNTVITELQAWTCEAPAEDSYEIGVNACLNKSVTAYDNSGNALYWTGLNGGTSLNALVDGVKGTGNAFALSKAEAGAGALGWAQVDMGQSVWINKVDLTIWHDWVFGSIIIQVSDDPTFSEGVTTVLSTDLQGVLIDKALAGSMDSTFDYNQEWIQHSGDGWVFNFAPVKGRYIRTSNMSQQYGFTVLTELQAWTCEAPAEDSYEIGVNACLNKSVTAYDNSGNALYWTGLNGGTSLNALVDGVKGTGNAFALSKAEAGAGALGWAQVDMGQSVWINKVDLTIWHDWVFGSIIIQVSDDPTFSEGVTTVLSTDLQGVLIDKALAGSMDSTFDYNREWIQHSGDGWVFNFAPVKGRYIRTSNMSQQYGFTVLTELQAWTCADPNAKSEYEYESFLSAVVAPETIEVYCGKAADELGLPNELTVKYSDGSEGKISVAWNVSAYNSSEAGEYVITGTATDALDAYGLLGDLAVNVTVKALDTTALDAAILTAGGVEAGKYTASTVNALTNAKTAAEVLVAQSYKTQEEVDAATNAISSAYEALKERGDVAALATLVNTWKNEEGSKYTASAYAAFEEALTAGKNAVAENGNADLEQAQVDKLYETLETTAKALTVRASGSDYAALQTEETRISSAIADEEKITLSGFAKAKALVEKAKAYLEADDELKAETTAEAVQAFTEELAAYAIVYRGSAAQLQEKYNEYKGAYGYSETSSGDYHIESYCVYMDAMYAAEPLFVAGACDDMTQEQIDVYKTALENSVAALVKHADVTALTNAFTNAKALKATDYTSSTYTVFLTVLEEVAPVAAKPANYLLQTEADEALAKLTAGVNALEKLGDKSTIKQLIALYSSEDAADYTSATFEKLETALFAANKVKNSDDVNEKAVKEATEALQAAYEGLHKLGDKTQLKEYLERAKAADTSAMTEEKLAALNAAIEYTQKVVDFEGEVTEAQVEAAKALIDAALAVEEEPSVIDTIKDKVQSVVGGCSAVTGGIGVAAVALGACICALRKKEEK